MKKPPKGVIRPGAAANPAALPEELAQLSDGDLVLLADELMVRSRRNPGSAMSGPDFTLAQIYLGEVNRRATEKQTRTMYWLAWAVAVMALVQAIGAANGIWRGH